MESEVRIIFNKSNLEKTGKYDILADEIEVLYDCKNTRIVPYMLWRGMVWLPFITEIKLAS